MKLKVFFQTLLVTHGWLWLFLWFIRRHRLDDTVVDKMIADKSLLPRLSSYVKKHNLAPNQISKIISGDFCDLMLDVVRTNKLSIDQQFMLINKNNALLYENYLYPAEYFNKMRRFDARPDAEFVLNMVKTDKQVAIEVFKIYVDNTCRDILSDELLSVIIKYDTFGTRYLLQKAELKKEQEEFIVRYAPERLLQEVIDAHELFSDQAQLLLVETNYELAKRHFDAYKLRSQALQTFHNIRKKNIAEAQALNGINPS